MRRSAKSDVGHHPVSEEAAAGRSGRGGEARSPVAKWLGS